MKEGSRRDDKMCRHSVPQVYAHMDAALTDLNLMLPPSSPVPVLHPLHPPTLPSFPGVRSLYNIPPVLTLISTVIYRRPGLRQIFGMAVQVAFQHGLRS